MESRAGETGTRLFIFGLVKFCSGVFYGCFIGVLWEFHGYFMGISGVKI
jgi:hypothetical protein